MLEDRIRFYARSALNGFETLDPEDAIENAKHDLRALLGTLDRADDAVGVLGVETVEGGVHNKPLVGQ